MESRPRPTPLRKTRTDMVATVSPQDLAEALSATETTLIDVRTPAEFGEAHVRGAENVPFDRLAPERYVEHAGPLFVVCQKGGRSRMACDKLSSAGVADVRNVAGGTLACEAAGLPLVRGRKAISLERQVRIAAGTLVLAGLGLGFAVHPGWLGLSAFVGAGLVFAGVTDTCGMGMLLARMPWNQSRSGD